MLWQSIPLLIALIGIGAAISLINVPEAPPKSTNMYAQAPKNPFIESVAATGLVEAYEQNIYLGVPVQALIKKVYVSVGDKVKAGALLLELDNRVQTAQVEIEKERVKTAQSTLAKALSQLERLKKVTDERAVSIEDLRNKEYDVEIARNQLNESQAQLESAKVALEQTFIICPKNATVLRFDLQEGEFAQFIPSDPSDTYNPPIVLGATGILQIRADVDEQNAYRIRPNQKAIAFTRGTLLVAIDLTFDHIEPFCIPKRNLSSATNERIDTRVLQVIYTFEPNDDYPVYVGQQVDIFIEAEVGLS